MSTVIKVENLGKRYLIKHKGNAQKYTTFRDVITGFIKRNPEMETQEEFWALKNLNFEIKHGDQIGIIGRNGAGKSTLLKIFSRITEPTTGSVRLKGRVASLLEVGTGFHPELSGRENIYLNGAILGMSRSEIRRKFDEIVAFAEIEKFLDTPVKRYSSGMYVRLAFSVAAHLESEILIVDEVLAVGDAQFQKKCLGRMGEVSKSGRTIVFVSHDLNSVRKICTKGIFLNNAQIDQAGEINSVLNRYYQLFSPSKRSISWCRISNEVTEAGFLNIKLLQKNGENYVGFQEEYFLQFELQTTSKLELTIGFSIENEQGVIIFTAHSNEIGVGLAEESSSLFVNGKSTITCQIRNNFLRPGFYKLNCSLFSRKLVRTFDYVESAIQFEVLESGTHFSFSEYQMGVVVTRDVKWSI